METNAFFSPPPWRRKNPLKSRCFQILLLLALRLLHLTPAFASLSDQSQLYHHHCNRVVPAPPLDASDSDRRPFIRAIQFDTGSFSGGDALFPNSISGNQSLKSAGFIPHIQRSLVDTGDYIYKLRAMLGLQIFGPSSPRANWMNRRKSRFKIRGPRIPVFGGGMPRFILNGYWSESTGNVCMVGSGTSYADGGKVKSLNVVLELHYSQNSTIFGSLVSGILRSLDDKSSISYFEPVSILGLRENDEKYEHTLVRNGSEGSCSSLDDGEEESLSLDAVKGGICSVLRRKNVKFGLEYGSNCGNGSCSPLSSKASFLPNLMTFRQVSCVEGKMKGLVAFHNSSFPVWNSFPFDLSSTLIAEGVWNSKKNRLCGVACRFLHFEEALADAIVGDCSVNFTFRFRKSLTLKGTSSIVGQIRSNKTEKDPGFFNRIRFRSVKWSSLGIPGLEYNYTEIDSVKRYCNIKKEGRWKGKKYPNPYSSDMRFDMLAIDNKGQKLMGYASPLFVGNQLYKYQNFLSVSPKALSTVQVSVSDSSLLNISYKLSLMSVSDSNVDGSMSGGLQISAEGIYNKQTGLLCMTGCRHLAPNNGILMQKDSLDCDITVTLHFSPVNAASTNHLTGSIESTRPNPDPLYFERIDVSSKSYYNRQAKDSIWRMDLEITMVLISNTLACIFMGLQLRHVKKHHQVLPFASILMLVILTVGYMIPLLLNFEALFIKNHSQRNVFLKAGGWLETNEILVRVATMVAFLLQFYLLQLSWFARQGSESGRDLGAAEKKTVYACLPLYITGGMIASIVYLWRSAHQNPYLVPHVHGRLQVYPKNSHLHRQPVFWNDLRSYGGLILDGFLLPQIVLNLFSNSIEKALSMWFYMGMTLVRLLPHTYDLYRSHTSSSHLDMSYIYADHKKDFYSTAWNIVIPLTGLLYAVIIFLQQRYGGQCFLPARFRKSSQYEMVPAIELLSESEMVPAIELKSECWCFREDTERA